MPTAPAADDLLIKASGSDGVNRQTASAFDVLDEDSDNQENSPSTSATQAPVNQPARTANGKNSYPQEATVSDEEASTSDEEDDQVWLCCIFVARVTPMSTLA